MNVNVAKKILQALQSLKKTQEDELPLHEPSFGGNELCYVKECIDSGWVSSVGKFVDEFELKLATFVGAKFAVACVNGTAALQICLRLAEIGKGDEVLVPAFTFVATVNAISYLDATPHFIEIDEETFCADPHKLRAYLLATTYKKGPYTFNKQTSRRIKAMVPVHIFGHSANIDDLLEVCREFNLVMVEDACEALGSYYKSKHVGLAGQSSAFSFNGNKIITTGGGGMIVTNNEQIAKAAKHLTTTAKKPHPWEYVHDQLGYNFRLPNINAALGCAQLEQLPGFLVKKRNLAETYSRIFAEIEGVKFLTEPSHCRSNYWLNTIILDESYVDQRDEILALSHRDKIFTRPPWRPLHELARYSACPKMDLSITEKMFGRVINIPSSAKLAVI